MKTIPRRVGLREMVRLGPASARIRESWVAPADGKQSHVSYALRLARGHARARLSKSKARDIFG